MICPRCKEDMPLLSKICPVCGYVVEGEGGAVSADAFVKRLEENLLALKRIPEPTLGRGFMDMAYIFYPVITFFLFILALLTESGLLWILTLVLVVMSVVKIVKKAKGKSSADLADKEFRNLKLEVEHNEREARRNYGKNREVSLLLEDISNQVSNMEAARKKQNRKKVLVWLAILILLLGFLFVSLVSVGRSIGEAENAEMEQFEEIF